MQESEPGAPHRGGPRAPELDPETRRSEEVASRADRLVHQLGNVLQVIRGHAEMRHAPARSDPDAALREIEQAAERGTGLVTELRDLLRATPLVPRVRPEAAPARADGPGQTVLIVDDSDEILRLAARILRNAGYRVLEAASGSSADRQVREHGAPIDLLLADVILAGETGLEVRDRIAALQPGIRSLFMSGFPDVVTSPAGLEHDAPNILGKPFAAAELVAAVREALATATSPLLEG